MIKKYQPHKSTARFCQFYFQQVSYLRRILILEVALWIYNKEIFKKLQIIYASRNYLQIIYASRNYRSPQNKI